MHGSDEFKVFFRIARKDVSTYLPSSTVEEGTTTEGGDEPLVVCVSLLYVFNWPG